MKTNISRVTMWLATAVLIVISASSIRAGDPIPGVDVSIEQSPGGIVRTVKSDKNGMFNFGDLTPGSYDVRLECNRCQSINIGASGVQFTLAAPKESFFVRVVSKQELISGVKFTFEIAGGGNRAKKNHGPYKGQVTLVR